MWLILFLHSHALSPFYLFVCLRQGFQMYVALNSGSSCDTIIVGMCHHVWGHLLLKAF